MSPDEIDFNAVPEKIFVDTVSMRIINGMQHLLFKSGQKTYCFLMPLPGAKFLGKGLLKQIEEIEQKNNIKIDVRLPDEPMLSPWTSENPDSKSPDSKK